METFLKVLDHQDSSTGGGSASAIAGAMAGAMLAMAARLSGPMQDGIDRDFYDRLVAHGKQLSQELLAGSQDDAQAFQAVRSAYQHPKQTAEEKATRQQVIQTAWLLATSVPLANAGRCLRVLELCFELGEWVNPKVLSDLRCALLLAQGGLLGCLENVQINLPAIKDATIAAQLAGQAGGLRERLARLDLATVLDSHSE
jgi:formiminotetrahydrofolate cyclodeaminase